jgi:hypothetical protein
MRALTAKQKKLLNNWFESWYTKQTGTGFFKDTVLVGNFVDDVLPNELWEKLEQINDTEILYQNVNRYLSDKLAEKNYGS